MRLGWAAVLVAAMAAATGSAALRGAGRPPKPRAAAEAEVIYRSDLSAFARAVKALPEAARAGDSARVRQAFRRARMAYKRVEYLLAYQWPEAAEVLNGPPVATPHETVIHAEVPPTGLQVIEALVFASDTGENPEAVRVAVDSIRPTLAALQRARAEEQGADSRIFDAIRLELARVSVVGIASADATVSKDGIAESAEALRGVRQALAAYRPEESGPAGAWERLDRRLAEAIADLETQADFATFDRLGFIADQTRPTALALDELQRALGIPRVRRPGWSARANTIFDAGAVSPELYAPSDAPGSDPAVVALGRALFFDPALSSDGRRSCATCHQPVLAFADGRAKASVDPGTGPVRNTPSLLTAALQPFQFADLRARSLEDQAAAVLSNPREMAQPLPAAVAALQRNTARRAEFAHAFRDSSEAPVTGRRLQLALAAYVRSLASLDARFDRAVRGDTATITPEERRGFNLFMGKAGCATCHFAPTFGGAVPPQLTEMESEVLGVPSRPVTRVARVDPDSGMAGFDHASIHAHAFKTPSLRNVALTAPYMHNGVYRTLEQVVDFYDRGGGAGIGATLPNQTLPTDRLELTRRERRELIAFLGTLTDTSRGRP
jgi:cytochrome c peroxidase